MVAVWLLLGRGPRALHVLRACPSPESHTQPWFLAYIFLGPGFPAGQTPGLTAATCHTSSPSGKGAVVISPDRGPRR